MNQEAELSPVDVAVIGAGMAGLSAAVYARLSGLTVRVFERHAIPGGLCTAWRRSGYTFDYCIEWFMGSGKDQGFYDMWKELGVIDRTSFRPIDVFGRYLAEDGRVLDLHTDPRRLREHMRALAPEDEGRIVELCEAIRRARRFLLSDFSLSWSDLKRAVLSLPCLSVMRKWAGVSVRGWCAELRSPLLREAIPTVLGMAEGPMLGPILAFGMMSVGNAAYPLGGSLPVAQAVADRAQALGAELVYKRGAKRVVVEAGRAVGVELDDGRVQRARHVVAACDARTAFDSLLQGQVRDTTYEALFAERRIHPGLVQVSLGVRLDPAWSLHELPHKVSLPLTRPIGIDGRAQTRMALHHYANDPRMAGEGGTVVLARFESDYDRWRALRVDPAAYEAEKDRILTETITALAEHLPGLAERVEVSDVATPTTCERYTGNWRGSTQGWVLTTDWMKRMTSGARLPQTFAGLDRFYLIGQWTGPNGGLPPAARSGRDVVRAIGKAEGRRAVR